ncbi:MAG: tRNA 5-hydroxyuridine modification protein YegQ [Rhodoferax sp.]
MIRRCPELLAPAGSLAMLRTALAFGANAVYAGQPRYSLRVRNNDFGSLDVLRAGIDATHAAGAKFYLVSNIFAPGNKVRHFVNHMAPVIALGPDALIMSDPGLILLAREAWPEMDIHLSVQANTVNAAAVRFWQRVGLKRIILSRELSLDQVAEIRQECPDMELEVFVHGALCIAYSGRCLLSGYFNHRDANQGTCTNACRWDYKTHPAVEDAQGNLSPLTPPGAQATCGTPGCGCASASQDAPNGATSPQDDIGYGASRPALGPFLLEEGQRPGSLLPIEEDEHGTYIMNSKDLRAVEHVARLVEIGVDSLKIEGRTKSPYYVARTVQSYRQAIADALAGRGFDPGLLDRLDGLANRGYTSGFFQRHAPDATQLYTRGYSASGRSQYVGDALDFDAARGLMRVNVRNRFAVGDRLEVIHPQGNRDLQVDRIENAEGQPMPVAAGSGHTVWLALPAQAQGAFLARYLQES